MTELFSEIPQIIDKSPKEDKEDEYEDKFIFIEFLLIFLIPSNKEVYYKHQKLSILIFILIEIIKIIVLIIKYKVYDNILRIVI